MKDFFTKDVAVKIVSLLIAFAIWMVVGLQNPELQKQYSNINVRYSLDGGDTNEYGLSVISNRTMQVEVVATGKRTLLANIQSSEIRAWVDTSDITEPGNYSLDIQVTMPASDVIIDRITPSRLNVRMDYIVSKEIPVTLYMQSELDSETHLVQSESVSPSAITVTGPATEIGNIAEARLNITVGSEGYYNDDEPFTLVSATGEEIDTTYISADVSHVTVSVPVDGRKEVPLTVRFDGTLPGYGIDDIPYTVSPATLFVTGADEVLENLNEIIVGTIDLSEITDTMSFEFEFEVPEGVTNTYAITKATVTLTVSEFTTKTIRITDFDVENVPNGAEAYVVTGSLDVRIRGKQEDLDAITADNLRAVVNLENKQISYGTYEYPVSFEISGSANCSVVGNYTVDVRVAAAQS